MVQFTDESDVPNPSAWQWDFDDGSTSTLQNPQHTYTSQGIYSVKLSVTGANGVVQTKKNGFIAVGVVPKTALFVAATDVEATVGISTDLIDRLSGTSHLFEIDSINNGDGTRTVSRNRGAMRISKPSQI